ncbi:MAG: DUF4185 domain-containing protein [Phycisphaerales bacterium]
MDGTDSCTLAPNEELSGTFHFDTHPHVDAPITAGPGRFQLAGPDQIRLTDGSSAQLAGSPKTVEVVEPPASTLRKPQPDSEWNAVFDRTGGWTGGDIGATVELGNDRTLWLFGDSWVGPIQDGRHAEGTVMVRNAMAVHATPRFGTGIPPTSDTVAFMWSRDSVQEQQPQWLGPADAPRTFESPPDKTWYWPMSDGVVVPDKHGRDRLVLLAAVIGPSGAKDGMWDFRSVGGVFCTIDNFNEDPHLWKVRQADNPLAAVENRVDAARAHVAPTGLLPAAIVYAPWSDLPKGERYTVHVFCTRETASKDRQLILAKAPSATLEQTSTWNFWCADGWSSEPGEAQPLASGFPTEFTIRYLEIDGRGVWVAIHSEPMLGHHIQARTALRPEGPWSAPKNIYLVPEVEADKRLITYAHKVHPQLSRRGELLASYIVNSSDFGQVMADASLYRPRFVRVPLSFLPKPPE